MAKRKLGRASKDKGQLRNADEKCDFEGSVYT